MSWMLDRLRHLALEERLFVVVDGIPIDEAAPNGADWRPLLKGLGHLAGTTVVTIAPVSGYLVDVTVQRGTDGSHSFATSAEAADLICRLHAEFDPATVYLGDGTHACALEPNLTDRDVNLSTTWRPCANGQAVAVAEFDKAKPFLEMLYLFRRDGGDCRASDRVASSRFMA